MPVIVNGVTVNDQAYTTSRGKNMNFICFRIPEIELVKGHFECGTGRLSLHNLSSTGEPGWKVTKAIY